ncbi:hypothetical protein AMST5_02516 [freshwater sediment metagenome]|jgi:hypothetical protein|uniref:Uncharacterized protein n=1 Tax=freshwater sediment metagenome TaxID=556182 RepID=A0AA48M061_9ZZZZ
MPASLRLITKDDALVHKRAVEPLHGLASAAVLLAIAVAVLVIVEAMSAPLADWASAQTLASLAPV